MKSIENAVERWLNEVVIGLNLCPFAAYPKKNNRVRIVVCHDNTGEALLTFLQSEIQRLSDTPASELETTLVVVPDMLNDFFDYNQFLDPVDRLLAQSGWEGVFQVASFHPDYCFGGNEPEDSENLTNRSPYPILHIIREASIEKALEHHPDPDGIPETNIARVNKLTIEEKRQLFSFVSF